MSLASELNDEVACGVLALATEYGCQCTHYTFPTGTSTTLYCIPEGDAADKYQANGGSGDMVSTVTLHIPVQGNWDGSTLKVGDRIEYPVGAAVRMVDEVSKDEVGAVFMARLKVAWNLSSL